ncbi:MAG TPA: hypothetical protein VFM32_01515 [Spongiibacteraceae bacterium]|nr:hypothetical protein [Spongiibacteraceae bacterium]
MSTREMGVVHHAVVFFDDNALVKEMLQVEFEAVLDQVVGLPEFAGREICACFLRINQRLQIIGTVFFLVDFDARGYVNRSWNVPLEHLLENAGRGPDLGGGRIRLACRSQCSVPWHARQLWDPVLEGESNSLLQMKQAVQRNRLGLAVEVPEITDVAHPPVLDAVTDGALSRPTKSQKNTSSKKARQQSQTPGDSGERINQILQQEYLGKLTALKEEQQLQIATLKSAAQQQIDQLHQHYQIQLSQMREMTESTQRMLAEEKRRSLKLKEKLATQTAEFQSAREQLLSDFAEQQEVEQRHSIDQLQQQFEVELKARVDQASAELKEMLDMREVELFYREEQLGTLREEVARLRSERERLIGQGADRLLEHLVENGVAFVAYQPGVDAMTIPVADIPRYLESPLAYVAAKCTVSVAQYQLWLSHHELPVCTARDKDGNICGELLPKVERPGAFLPGSSDRCALHATHRQDEPELAPRASQAGLS